MQVRGPYRHVDIPRLLRPLGIWAAAVTISACAGLLDERVVHEQQGRRVAIQPDPSIRRETSPATNNHPATLSPDEFRVLLGTLEVSGGSGTLTSLIAPPRPIPLLQPTELDALAEPLATAFRQAGPRERVWFTLPNRQRPYSDDRITGALFFRGAFLHVILTDHSAFERADTGGGEEKDWRDTKGMKLWLARPLRAAGVPPQEEPRWAPFETVHVSLHVSETLAIKRVEARMKSARDSGSPAAPPPPPDTPPATGKAAPDPSEDLRLQIRELTNSNLELRGRLDQQSREMKALQDEISRLQQKLTPAKPKSQATKPPAP